jgi:uncharacterized membrane protein
LLAIVAIFLIELVRNQRGVSTPVAAKLPGMAPAPVGDRTPDSCWRLGMFYINPRDPALFVVRRFSPGYTLNMGNPWSWVILATLLVVVFIRASLRASSK